MTIISLNQREKTQNCNSTLEQRNRSLLKKTQYDYLINTIIQRLFKNFNKFKIIEMDIHKN